MKVSGVERFQEFWKHYWLAPWRKLVGFIRLQGSVRTIDLEKTYESCFDLGDTFEAIIAGKTNKTPSSPLKTSVYIQFLEKLKDRPQVTDADIKETKYYQEAWQVVKDFGHYQGVARDEAALVEYCRNNFLKLFQAFRKRAQLPWLLKVIRTQIDYFKYGYPDVFQVHSGSWMAYDGHHRLACLYEAGERFVKAKVVGVVKGQQGFQENVLKKKISGTQKISVIIPTYNRADVLLDMLNDLAKQKTNSEFDYEVVVADNNSKDHTKKVVESLSGRFQGSLTYVFEPKQARAHALNAGLKVAKGDIICCVDDDCILEENYLWNVYKAFQDGGPDVGMIGGKILPQWLGGESPVWLNELFSQPARYEDGKFNRIKIGFEGVLGILDLGNEPFLINEAKKIKSSIQFFGANIAFRKKIFEQYGEFSAVNRIGEDTEMCERLINAGVKGVYAPTVWLRHKIPVWKATPKFYYHWWFQQGVHLDLRGKYERRFYFPFGISPALIRQTMDFLQKFIQEKDPLIKIQWRMYVHYHLGQMANIFNKNII